MPNYNQYYTDCLRYVNKIYSLHKKSKIVYNKTKTNAKLVKILVMTNYCPLQMAFISISSKNNPFLFALYGITNKLLNTLLR